MLDIFGKRLALLFALLIGGGLLFQHFEPHKNHSLPKAMYYTWTLVFGGAPEEFPVAPALQILFFAVPLLGLGVLLETLAELVLLLRDRRRNERSWCRLMAASLSNHVILVGLGKLGIRTFRLLRQLGESVAVIEREPHNQFLEEIRREGSPLFVGDARRESLLIDAHVVRAKSIILATNSDLTNLETALDARRLHPGIRVVLRMFDQNMADKVRQGFGIPVAMSQSEISAPAFATAALEQSVLNGTTVNGQLVVMQRWTVHGDGPLAHQTISDVMRRYRIQVVERRAADGQVDLIPLPDVRLAPGDELLVQGTFAAITGCSAPGAGLLAQSP